jgi:uncharacterized RDD family membrane protein YckC
MIHEVLSTEKVVLHFRVAGLGSRFLAWLVDLAVIAGLFYIAILEAQTWEFARSGVGLAVVMLLTFVIQWCYFLLFEWLWHGQTPGKRLIGIRVIDLEGVGISFGQAAYRNLLRVVDALPLLIPDLVPVLYSVGFAVAATNHQQRRLGDLAAQTLVVFADAKPVPLFAIQRELGGSGSNPQALRPRLEQLTRSQKDTLLDLCLRRDQLRVRERARLFAAVADYFRQRWQLGAEEYQSDEKFVLQLAAVLTADLMGSIKQ